jgi:hypothetical protein
MPHIHGGAAHIINTFLGVIAVGAVWRVTAIWLAPMPGIFGSLGKAMSFFY